MATFPNEQRQYVQENRGQFSGNTFATYGIDLTTEKGLARVSEPSLQAITSDDDSSYNRYAGAIFEYDGSYIAMSDKAFSSNTATGNWNQMTIVGDEPDTSDFVVDGVVFNGLALISDTTGVKSFDGTSWDNWWGTELGETALTTGRHLMEVGPDRNLYIVETVNKLYKVDIDDNVTKTGQGTLDYSATEYEFSCLESNSTRMWIGTENTEGGEAIIIEWDLSATSTTANREHRMGAKKVVCIAIWNDTPIAVLSNGKIKYFNGSSFVDYPRAQFPSSVSDVTLRDDYIHPNGWAIIDNLPHFLIKGSQHIADASTVFENSAALWNMPSGVWCLDPEIGIYCRYALGEGADTQNDFGQPSIRNVGALYAVQEGDTKFLAGYELNTGVGSASLGILGYHDPSRTHTRQALLATSFVSDFTAAWQQIELFFKQLTSGEKLRSYYRTDNSPAVTCEGLWDGTDQLNTTTDVSAFTQGNLALIKTGSGAGEILEIEKVTVGATVNQIKFKQSATYATDGGTAGFQLLAFKPMEAITSTTLQNKTINIPTLKQERKMQFLFVYDQASGSTMEQEYCIIKE